MGLAGGMFALATLLTVVFPPVAMPAAFISDDGKRRPALRGLGLLVLFLTISGCAAGRSSRYVVGRPAAAAVVSTDTSAAGTLVQAQELDRAGQARAVELYYQAAVQAVPRWQQFQTGGAGDSASETAYRQALFGLVDSAQRYGRYDPRRQMIVVDGGGRVVPIRYFGFAWRPDDFSRLASAEQTTRDIAHHYRSPGLGLPLIGERVAACPQETFFRPWQPFAVTAVLRPANDSADPALGTAAGDHTLDLYNPLVFDAVPWGGVPRPLARDLTAPLAATVNEVPRQYLRRFTAPSDTSVQPQLMMVEPYQRGKMPVVFIHGLYSDPITWVDMVNELRVQRDLYDQYQFWTFRYPTGGDVLMSAAVLRQRLLLARETFDAQHTDRAMDSMVLVGHSLGGLVSKMQITTSSDILWREMALQPFDALRAPPEVRLKLAQALFYEPVPMVTRVVFIGTPHRGSGMTRRLAGRIGSALVKFGEEEDGEYRQVIDDNRGLFKPALMRGRPTSIHLLDPRSPFLAGLAQMPVNGATRMHSIIGTGGGNPLGEPGDGVVAVSSAAPGRQRDLCARQAREAAPTSRVDRRGCAYTARPRERGPVTPSKQHRVTTHATP